MATLNQNTIDLQAVLDTVNALPDKVDTSGTAEAADIYTGKTATVNDQKITGTNPWNAANVDPAVADALAALVEKGVDTTGAGLPDLAGLIAGIEAGGVSLPNCDEIYTGSFVLSEETSVDSYEVFVIPEEGDFPYECGVFGLVYNADMMSNEDTSHFNSLPISALVWAVGYWSSTTYQFRTKAASYKKSDTSCTSSSTYGVNLLNANGKTLYFYVDYSVPKYPAGSTYGYIVFKLGSTT